MKSTNLFSTFIFGYQIHSIKTRFSHEVNSDKTKDPNRVFSMILVEEMIYAAGKQVTQAQLKTLMANMGESTFTEAKFCEILSSLGFINSVP